MSTTELSQQVTPTNSQPTDFQGFRVRQDSLLLEIPEDALKRNGIFLPEAEHISTMAKVILVGMDVRDIEPGDKIMVDPNLPKNQRTTIQIDGKDYWLIYWYEALIYRKADGK